MRWEDWSRLSKYPPVHSAFTLPCRGIQRLVRAQTLLNRPCALCQSIKMEFAVQFKPGVSASVVEATCDLLSAIDGVQATTLSLPPKTPPALLVSLRERVINATYEHFTSQHYGVRVSSASLPTTAGAGGNHSAIEQKAAASLLNASITPAEAVLLGISFLEAVQVRINVAMSISFAA